MRKGVTAEAVTPYFLCMSEQCDLIESIQSSGFKACIITTGGGSGAIHEILAHPGASRFVLDARIPYSRESMNEFLGVQPESYCTKNTALLMAEQAYEHAGKMTPNAIGISCTAALKTNVERGNPDRAFVCFFSGEKVEEYQVGFKAESRVGQEEELSRMIIEKLALFLGKG